MDPIIVDGKGTSEKIHETKNTDKLEPVKYQGFDKEVYEFVDSGGEKWFQQVAAERMLGVRTRQFDLYCLCGPVLKSKFTEISSNGDAILSQLTIDGILEEINSREVRLRENLDQNKAKIQEITGDNFDPIWSILQQSQSEAVEKRRIHTGHYSYNFIKESDIFRIAKAKGKTIRLPLKDIPTTDDKEKIFSKTDLTTIIDQEINQRAPEIFKGYTDRITILETTNTNLNSEVIKLSKEKFEVLDKKRIWKFWAMVLGTILVIGGGVATVFIYTTNKDNDRLYDERNGMAKMITSLNAENSNLNIKTKMQGDEIEILKKQVPVTQNPAINVGKKD